MDKSVEEVMIRLFAEVLPLLETDEERMMKLEEFDDVCGVSIPGWEVKMKAIIQETGHKNAPDAIRDIDAFHAKYHVYDENGNPIYERTRVGDEYHQLVITYDSRLPEGQRFSVKEVPCIEEMSLEELQSYHDEIQDALDETMDEEPEDKESVDFERWESRCSELEDLLDEVSERLEEMGGDV